MWGLIAKIGIPAALVWGAVKFQRTVWFYRDPERTPDSTDGVLISPADGMVVYARPFKDGQVVSEKLDERIPITEITHQGEAAGSGWMLGIYMSPLDVHFNYSPCDARIESIRHNKAKINWPMIDMWEYVRIVWLRRLVELFGRRFHLENERTTIFMRSGSLRLALALIADKFVNKIKCFVEEGQQVPLGGKLAFISRGSQVDVIIFDEDVELLVKPGDRVLGGKSVIARLGQGESS